MKLLKITGAALLAMAIAACGSDSKDKNTCGTPLVTKPAGAVAVSFSVDDTANKLFNDQELEWKGSMAYDPTTWVVTFDTNWAGPSWAPLFDDGGWDCGGHEAIGAKAGDHKFGTTVFVQPPATGEQPYEYGLIDRTYEDDFGNGWIWKGSNGSFTITAGQTTDVTATGMSIPAFGTTDLKLTLDTGSLAGTRDTSAVGVKGSAWAWGSVALNDDGTKGDATAGDGIFTFVLSEHVGAGKEFIHTGLMKAGDKPEFVWVLGDPGVEYKNSSNVCETSGVGAQTKPQGGAFADRTVEVGTNGNTFVTVP